MDFYVGSVCCCGPVVAISIPGYSTGKYRPDRGNKSVNQQEISTGNLRKDPISYKLRRPEAKQELFLRQLNNNQMFWIL